MELNGYVKPRYCLHILSILTAMSLYSITFPNCAPESDIGPTRIWATQFNYVKFKSVHMIITCILWHFVFCFLIIKMFNLVLRDDGLHKNALNHFTWKFTINPVVTQFFQQAAVTSLMYQSYRSMASRSRHRMVFSEVIGSCTVS